MGEHAFYEIFRALSIYCKFGNFREGLFRENKKNVEISLSLSGVVYSCPSREFETWRLCLNAIRENKVLAKFFRIYSTF